MSTMQHFHILKVKYLGATNTLPSRVKITSDRFNQSKTIPYDYQKNNIEDMAAEYLASIGYNIIGQAEGYIVSDSFQPLKK